MKCNNLFFYLLLMSCLSACCSSYDITSFGASVDSKNNAPAINSAIEACASRGGGRVIVPKGTFICGTIHLLSGVSIVMRKGAVLRGSDDLNAYEPFIPEHDLSQYDSGDGTVNVNNSHDPRWNRALILASGISGFSIQGKGTIDGGHVFDPMGEEYMRGPHTLLFAESRDFRISGISIIRAANYAFMSYCISDGIFRHVSFEQGWDGIHIRGGERIVLDGCSFKTGDDAIAGGFWTDFTIKGCDINSACNGIRIIMPVDNVEICDCSFEGPGVYPHRTSGEKRRCNMLSALNLQPGGWGYAPGPMDNIYIHDVYASNVATPLMITLNKGNSASNITVENLVATGVYGSPIDIERWEGTSLGSIRLKDVSVSFEGNGDPSLVDFTPDRPYADYRTLSAWAIYAQGIDSVFMENVSFSYTGTDYRPALVFDNVGKIEISNVCYSKSCGPENTVFTDCGNVSDGFIVL